MIELSISCNDCGELAARVSNMRSQMPFLGPKIEVVVGRRVAAIASANRATACRCAGQRRCIEHHSVIQRKTAMILPLRSRQQGAMISHSLFDKSNSPIKASIW
jgi:hypothetical protein